MNENKKPKVILIEDIVNLFNSSENELQALMDDIKHTDEQMRLKSSFLYSYAIFESTLVRSYSQLLYGFPEKINDESDVNFKKYKNIIVNKSLTHTIIEIIADDFSKKMSYGRLSEMLKKYYKVLEINNYKINSEILDPIKDYRNLISHNDALSNMQKESVVSYVDTITQNIKLIREKLSDKYSDYTRLKLIRDSWNYLFNSTLLVFENYWIIKDCKIYSFTDKTLKEVHGALSSSEKTFLILFMSNYGGVCEQYYSLSDISLHASTSDRDKIAYITELFDRYPLLLQQLSINGY